VQTVGQLVKGVVLADDLAQAQLVLCALERGTGADPAYAVPGWTAAALCQLGPRLLMRKDAVALRWFERQRARVSRWVSRDVDRLQPQLDVWDAACKAMQGA